jgi:hypothetical protein
MKPRQSAFGYYLCNINDATKLNVADRRKPIAVF